MKCQLASALSSALAASNAPALPPGGQVFAPPGKPPAIERKTSTLPPQVPRSLPARRDQKSSNAINSAAAL